MGKTMLLSDIKKIIDPTKEALIVGKDIIVIYEVDHKTREILKMKAAFNKVGNKYVKLDLEKAVRFIVKQLTPHIDVERWLKELLELYSGPTEIMELKERLEKAPKITEAKRCYSLMIGGKRGRPYEFNLVG